MKQMDNQKFFEYLFLFLSASLASVFKYFNEDQKRMNLFIAQLLFGCFIAFIAVPYFAELITMSYKGSLFFTWVLTYFSNNALQVVYKLAFAKFDGIDSGNSGKENENVEQLKNDENEGF